MLINAPDEGSEYYNYKGFNTLVLMEFADYKYCVSYFEVGEKGSESDGRVFQKLLTFETFGEWIASHWKLPCWGRCIPTLKHYLMKAYKNYNRPLTQEESIFKYRLS